MRGLAIACTVFAAACAERAAPGVDGGAPTRADAAGAADAAPGDATAAIAADAGAGEDAGPGDTGLTGLGNRCRSGADCPSDYCLSATDNPSFPKLGYCTRPCRGDIDCPGGVCSPELPLGLRVCLLPCDAARRCADPRHLCNDLISGVYPVSVPFCYPGTSTAADGSPCESWSDCRANQGCLNNRYEWPGGFCTTAGCSPFDPSSCNSSGDGVCRVLYNLPLCSDGCARDEDCRSGYTCAQGSCTPGGWRRPPSACTGDAECAPLICLTGPRFPGGTCGLLGCLPGQPGCSSGLCPARESCPRYTQCHDPTPGQRGDEYCALDCERDEDCRVADGYRCVPLDPQSPDGARICLHP